MCHLKFSQMTSETRLPNWVCSPARAVAKLLTAVSGVRRHGLGLEVSGPDKQDWNLVAQPIPVTTGSFIELREALLSELLSRSHCQTPGA